MAAQLVNARIERRVGALGRVGRQRAGDERRPEYAFNGQQAGQCFRRRKLSAVEQREAFLRSKHDWRESGPRERGVGRHDLSGKLHCADAQHRRSHVRERGEIPGGPDRALARYHRSHLARQHGFEHADCGRPHA
jgi:hypothetical protein